MTIKCKECNNPDMLFVGTCVIPDKTTDIPPLVKTGMEYFCERCKMHYVYVPVNWEFVRSEKYIPPKQNYHIY